MSRGQDRRQGVRDKIAVLDSIRGHDNTVAHRFNHTDGVCPKCNGTQQLIAFCDPYGASSPKLRGCELEGEHLHRICAACKYPWIERPMDQAMLAEKQGVLVAESEAAAALAVIVERADGVSLDYPLVQSRLGWKITFQRHTEDRQLTLTVSPPDPQKGAPAHPPPDFGSESDQ